jgi:hypothetical protein
MPRFAFLLMLTFLAAAAGRGFAGEILVIRQEYNIVENGKEGVKAKDISQTIYISPDGICIDEDGGKEGDKVTETIYLDLKNRLIVNLDHENKKKVTESFDDRRKRIENRKRIAQKDLDDQDPGPRKDRMEKLYRALLDDHRKFSIAKDSGAAKEISGVTCNPVKIIVAEEKGYEPLTAQLHPETPLPYDNAEVLYLLQIIGKRMADYLRENKDKFKYVPMELSLDLAAGGTLHTKVVSVQKIEKAKLAARGALGDPFTAPAYAEVEKRRPAAAPKRDEPEKAD